MAPRLVWHCRVGKSATVSLFAVLSLSAWLSGQATPWDSPTAQSYDPVTHTPSQSYNTNVWQAPGSYQTPNPFTQPTREDTQRFVNNNPVLRNLDPITKSNIIDGRCSSCLSMPYLNGQSNPFYQNGNLVPNWYLPATWSSLTMNWMGVQKDGSLPSSVSALYNLVYDHSHLDSYVNEFRSDTTTHYNSGVRFPASQSFLSTQPSNPPPSPLQIELMDSLRRSIASPEGNITKTIADMNRTLSLHETANDKVAQAVAHAEMATLYADNGQLDQAFQHAATAEQEAEQVHNPKFQTKVLIQNAATYMSSGEFNRAIDEYDKAIQILKSNGDDQSLAKAYARLGWTYESLGKPTEAFECYGHSLTLFQKLHDSDGEVLILIGEGSIYQSMGQFHLAVQQYDKAFKAASNQDKARILASVGEMLLSQGQTSEALQFYNKALSLVEPGKDLALQATILAALGRCYSILDAYHSYSSALGFLQQAQLRMHEMRNRQGEAGVLASIGELNYRASISPFFVLGFCPDGGCPLNSAPMFSKALKNYNDALNLIRGSGDRAGEIGILTNIGLVFDVMGYYGEAAKNYRKALDLMDELQASARIEEFRINIANQAAALYSRAISLEAHLGHSAEAFDLSERARARAFLDHLGNPRTDKQLPEEFVAQEKIWKQANISLERRIREELAKPGPEIDRDKISSLESQRSKIREQYLQLVHSVILSHADYAGLLTIAPLTLHEVQQQLDPDVTAVSYFTTPDATLAFVITRKKFHVKELNINADELAEAVATFLDFAGDSSVPPGLKSLHKALIAPIKSHLKTTRLAIIPHGVLHDVPFAALTRDGTRYLSDDYSVFSLPSLSVLPYIHARKKSSTQQALIFANDREEGLPVLDHAYDEAHEIAAQFHTQPILGSVATAAEFQKMAGDYDIIHLIAHIEHDKNNPSVSRIILGHGESDDGALETSQIAGLDLRKTSLVVLSGCQSQAGSLTRGDDVVGLSRAFIYAGSPTVIASLWSVDDEATRALMTSFYSHLTLGLGPADALRAAQIDVRQKYPHPYYWSGFVLTGDPGTTPASNIVASMNR